MAFGIQPVGWPSGRLSAQIAGILAQEVLGVHATLLPEAPSSLAALWGVGGCSGDGVNRSCGADASEAHVAMEVWDSSIASSLASMRGSLGRRMPQDLGSIGYAGFESLFVPLAPRARAMNARGLPLEFYSSHNSSWHDPAQYFHNYTALGEAGLVNCSETRFYLPGVAKAYFDITRDAGGVEEVGGATVARCDGGPSGHWWFSPACRADPRTCVPAITTGDGWFLDAMMQRAAAFNMPLALAVATQDTYAAVPKTLDMLFYWWVPDITFVDLRPMPVKFPDHDKALWDSGNMITDAAKVPCRKWASPALATADSRVRDLMQSIELTNAQIDEMLLQVKTNASKSEATVACEWLRDNPLSWQRWVRQLTRCAEGWGLVDATDAYVLNRSAAISCMWCPPGRFSERVDDGEGTTHICVACPRGRQQPSPAQTGCLACDEGRFSADEGASVCDRCAAGEASAEVGSSACGACPPGSFQAMRGSTACEACRAGTFQDAVGATACARCDRGYFSGEAATSCTPCAAGSASAKLGSDECVLCDPGRFAGEEGRWTCTVCPMGEFADVEGSTACTVCGGGAELWTTMRRMKVKKVERWVATDGATSAQACGCDEGARRDADGRCVECDVEGIDCPGMGEVIVLPGFYSPAELSVFACHTTLGCPGGPPGQTCEEGRESICCTRCADGLLSMSDGSCEPCVGTDKAPFFIAVVAAILACSALYALFERDSQGEPSHSVLLAGISGGLLVGLMQQLSVLGVMNISYAEPLATFLQIMRIFAFDVEDFLRLSCVGHFTPLAHFVSKVTMILSATACVGIIHVVVVVTRHGCRFRDRRFVVIAVFGTLAMIFYISITLTILRPLQCDPNPNGMWTNHVYEDVICWEWGTEQGRDHLAMIVISAFALSLPVSMLALVVVLARRYPSRVRRGDIEFLRSYGFLFFRFRPQAHWYILVVMCRSLFVGMIPVVPHPTLQIYLLMIVLLATLETALHYKPWRVANLNWMDTGFASIMVMFLTMASFMVKGANTEVLGWICVSMVLLAMHLLPMILIYAALKRFGGVSKAYRFFLCHAKVDAGVFARWMKMELLTCPGVTREVFLDADNLESLDSLLSFVATDVQTLVVLGSRAIFFRPWCIGEMTTANNCNVDSILVALPGMQALDQQSIDTFDTLVPDLDCLLDNGLRIDAIRRAMAEFSAKPSIQVPVSISSVGMGDLSGLLVKGATQGVVSAECPAESKAKTAIIADLSAFEANAAAYVLQRLLVTHTCHDAEEIPQVQPAQRAISEHTEKVLIVCTAGCFDQAAFIGRILEVSERSLLVLPVIADGDFRVPTRDAVLAMTLDGLPPGPDGVPRTVGDVSSVITALFKEIAVSFNPKSATASVLDATVARVGQRLAARRMRAGLGPATSASFAVLPGEHSDGDDSDPTPSPRPSKLLPSMSRWRESFGDAFTSERSEGGEGGRDPRFARRSLAWEVVASIAINGDG